MHGTGSAIIRNLKGIGLAIAIGALAAAVSVPGVAQPSSGEHAASDLSEAQINDIIQQFAAKEAAFARAYCIVKNTPFYMTTNKCNAQMT